MTSTVETLHPDTSAAEARERLEQGAHGAYPVVDDHGRCVGIIAREDLLTRLAVADSTVADLATAPVVTVTTRDTVLDALTRILDEEVGHLPVVDHDRLVGLVTRTDILRARSRQLDLEHRQPGLRLRRPSPATTGPSGLAAAARSEGT
jgi:CBS domain-containing protein